MNAEDEYLKVLVCPTCHSVCKDKEMVYQQEENGIIYLCKCESDYQLGILAIGCEAVSLCENALLETQI